MYADILSNLEKARSEVQNEYQARLTAIDRAIAAFGETPGHVHDDNRLSIGDDKLHRVLDVLRANRDGHLRQADIAKRTKLNSGSVSVALRKLQAANQVRATGRKENGSMVWEDLHHTDIAA